MRRTVAFIGLAGALTAGGCESSQSKSARLEKLSVGLAKTHKVKVGQSNPDVDVLDATVLHTAIGNAAVVRLRNRSRHDEAALPLQIVVEDAKGAPIYTNDTAGLQPALQQLALLRGGSSAYWVNDQVAAATTPKRVSVRVGRGTTIRGGGAPRLEITGAHLRDDSSGAYAEGRVKSTGAAPLRQVPVFGVALRGGKVVAAGRAIVDKVPGRAAAKPVRFKLFFVGDPRGARLVLNAVPTSAKGAA